ncbi:MAG: MMPL family transporter, partial [Chitinivibrionales bacterium]|nr:MMPL family transporter [Chitinivibrionales bacterium]
LGTMALLNIPITIVTIMVSAFVFGLGIDYALVMLHFCVRDSRNSVFQTAHAAASVTVAALTTFAGLGAMVLANHPVLQSLGVTGLIGITSSYFCAVVIVPSLMRKK